MSDLFSKVLAGGLSAGVFLLWWPAHVTAAGSEWLVVRGILWSLVFEMLLLAYRPLEQAIAGAVRNREPRTLRTPRLARVLTLAAVAVALPLVMLSGSEPPAAAPARAAAPKVIVKREIVRREVIVRRVNHIVRVPGPTVTTMAPAPVATPAATRAASTVAAATTKRTPAARSQVVTSSASDTNGDRSSATGATGATTAATTAAQPATSATTTSAAVPQSAATAATTPAGR